jgi:hypothetical protein
MEGLLVAEHFLLGGGSAGGGEAAETAVGAQDAMTWDDQRDGIARHDAAHGSGGVWTTHLSCQIAVSRCLAETYSSACQQNLVRERA